MPKPCTAVPGEVASDVLDAIYRRDARRVFATLVRLIGDFDRAEEALHEAFRAALERWPGEGVPANPAAWLVSAGRFKAIDALRRDRRIVGFDDVGLDPESVPDDTAARAPGAGEAIEDDRLRLIFTCCHPSLAPEARIALTLREVCGLATEEIASAFLVPAPTLAQRIVRAKAKIRAARIPYEVPSRDELPQRLSSVLRVVYLVFNEGYSASSGGAVTRRDLTEEAIRLARLLAALLPEPEVYGLLALMLLNESRRAARSDAAGELVPLDEQDRGLWSRVLIEEGCALVRSALIPGRPGPYALQAAISALHAEAASPGATDWSEITGLYDLLLALEPSPVVELNRAIAVAMRDGPDAGLALVDTLLARGCLDQYHLAHAARADLCRRLGRAAEARAAYDRALKLAVQEPERRFLARRLFQLPK
jgi:RNA polymerase sigma-70 factor (ECF subfamily)